MNVLLVGFLFVSVMTLAYVALRARQDFSDANEIIPGVPTRAPKQWAGAHSTEARLHRRLRDAMSALRESHGVDAAELADVMAALEREALAIDDHLITVAALPARTRVAPLEACATAVQAVEDAVTDVVLLRGPTHEELTMGIERVRTRVGLVREARRELAELGPGGPPAPDPEDRPPT